MARGNSALPTAALGRHLVRLLPTQPDCLPRTEMPGCASCRIVISTAQLILPLLSVPGIGLAEPTGGQPMSRLTEVPPRLVPPRRRLASWSPQSTTRHHLQKERTRR